MKFLHKKAIKKIRVIFQIKIVLILFLLFIRIYSIYNYINIMKNQNIIKLGILVTSLKNGGVERQTSLLLNYFKKIEIFKLFLFIKKDKEKDEYKIGKKIKRIVLKYSIINYLKEENIDILLYQFYDYNEINDLYKLNKTKIIIINRSCFLHWIYYKKFDMFKNYYKTIKKANFIISLVPFENDYLFKKWGINSILMNNFLSYEYDSIVPSDLSSKEILMLGRGDDGIKRFDLGIKAMKYIINRIPECKMIIISKNID